MRTLTFEQITDTRFDTEAEKTLAVRVNTLISKLRSMVGVHVFHDGIYKATFEGEEPTEQFRCRFWVRKDGRGLTWNDIYKVVNSVKAVPYRFADYNWDSISENI